jgi:hypothetical protein
VNLPRTLGIRTILQGGSDRLRILIAYDPGSLDTTLDSVVQWQVLGVDADFSHSAPADPSGNTIGPFAIGQTVNIRTRVTNGNGTTTGSVRTLKLI